MRERPHAPTGRRRRTRRVPYEGELQFRRLLDKLPAAAYTCDADGLITYFNEHAVRLWGRVPRLRDPVDRFCGSFKLLGGDGTPIVHAQSWMAQALKLDEEFNRREIIVVRPDGQRRIVLAHANPIHDESGTLLGAVNVLMDITERKAMEDALRRSEERLRRLNQSLEERVAERTKALLAHQKRLRSLASHLNAVALTERRRLASSLHDNLAQLLAVCKIRLGALRRRLSRTGRQGDIRAAVRALDDALRYTRSILSELTPPVDRIDNDLPRVIRMAAEKLRTHGLTVMIDDDGRPKPVAADALMALYESVRELLFNVLRHSRRKTARISVNRKGDRVAVEVSDAGVGFDPSQEPSNPDERGGFGLLSIRESLASSGGDLELHSAHGKGTRAIVTIPIRDTTRRVAPGRAKTRTAIARRARSSPPVEPRR